MIIRCNDIEFKQLTSIYKLMQSSDENTTSAQKLHELKG